MTGEIKEIIGAVDDGRTTREDMLFHRLKQIKQYTDIAKKRIKETNEILKDRGEQLKKEKEDEMLNRYDEEFNSIITELKEKGVIQTKDN